MNSFPRASALAVEVILALSFCQFGIAQNDSPGTATLVDVPNSAPGQAASTPNGDSNLHFELSPYLWFAGAHGTVGALGRDVSIHASPGDLLSHFNIGLIGLANRFGGKRWHRH